MFIRGAALDRPGAYLDNRVQQSEAWASSPWFADTGVTMTNNTGDLTDPLGGNTATKIVYNGTGAAGQYLIAQSWTGSDSVAGEIATISFWARTASGTAQIRVFSNASAQAYLITLTTSWQRFTFSDAAQGAGIQWQIALYLPTGDATAKTFYVWGAQGLRGYMASENRLLRSEDFTLPNWQNINAVTITSGFAAPDGSTGGMKLVHNGTNYLQQNSANLDATINAVGSVWLRADSPATYPVQVGDAADGNPVYTYNLPLTTSWQRFFLPFTQTTGTTSVALILGLGFTGTVYGWGAQLNVGNVGTEYVKTGASVVTIPPIYLKTGATGLRGRIRRTRYCYRATS